jgi:hypothetical protein
MLRIKTRLFFHFTHFPAGKGWFLVFLITLAVYCWSISCTGDNACKQSRDVFLMVSFRTTVHNTEHDTTLSYLTVYGLGRSDSLLYDSAQVNKVSLPLILQPIQPGLFLRAMMLWILSWLFITGNHIFFHTNAVL